MAGPPAAPGVSRVGPGSSRLRPSDSPIGDSRHVSHCLGHKVPAKNPRSWDCRVAADYAQEVRKFHPDWFIKEIGMEVDYVHLHMVIPPKDAVVQVMDTLKSVTSARLKENLPHFQCKVHWDGRGIY